MDKKLFEKLSYGAIGIVAVLLVLMLLKIIPREANLYVLFFAVMLLVLRLVFRVVFFIKDRKADRR